MPAAEVAKNKTMAQIQPSSAATTNSGLPSGVGLYDFATKMTTEISDGRTDAVKWLADSRRVVYFANHGSELVVQDTITRKRTVQEV